MGAVTNKQEDRAALAILHGMPIEARKWLQHHFGNALAGAKGMLELGRYREAMGAIDHAVSDLRQLTPPNDRAQIKAITKAIARARNERR